MMQLAFGVTRARREKPPSVADSALDDGVTTGNVKTKLHRARRAMHSVQEPHCDCNHREASALCGTPKPER